MNKLFNRVIDGYEKNGSCQDFYSIDAGGENILEITLTIRDIPKYET